MYVVFISDAGFAVDLYKSIQSFLFRFFPSLGKFLRLFFGFTSFNSMASSQPTGPIELILICIQTISCVVIRNKKTTIKYTMQIFAMYPLCMVLWCLLQGVPVVNYFHWTLYDVPILRLFHLTPSCRQYGMRESKEVTVEGRVQFDLLQVLIKYILLMSAPLLIFSS